MKVIATMCAGLLTVSMGTSAFADEENFDPMGHSLLSAYFCWLG